MSYKPRKWKFRIRHILEAIEKIQQYTKGMSYSDFLLDVKTRDAVSNNLIVIGEAARHIPVEIESSYDHIPWRKMRGLRNVITHEYDRIDTSILWMVVQEDLPSLIDDLQELYDEVVE